MKKLTLASYLLIGVLFVLAGCKNGDDTAFDEVGEMRVFNGSHHVAAAHNGGSSTIIEKENVPAPKPVLAESAPAEKPAVSEVAVAAKPATRAAAPVAAERRTRGRSSEYRHVMVGELNMDD